MVISSKVHSLTNTTKLRRTALLVAIATSIGAVCSVPKVFATSPSVQTVPASPVQSRLGGQFTISQNRVQENVQGVIYAVMDNGDLRWNRHEGRSDGTGRWASTHGETVGTGWNVQQVFSSAQ